jgi:RNA polymerase sigma factor (sigma-70 family)
LSYSSEQLPDLTDKDLAALCLLHQRNAWEEFFKRFSPLIKKAIRRTFIRCGVRELAEDFDNIADIHAELVEKLYGKGILRKCSDLTGLRPWLIRITINQTLQWLVRRSRLKRLPQVQEEQLMRRLSAPLGEDQDFTLQDLIEDAGADLFQQLEQVACQHYTECVVDQIAALDNPTHRWTLRLSTLGQLSLSEAELAQLQALSTLDNHEIEERISALEDALAKKEQERQDTLGKAVLAWHQQRGIEVKITRLGKDSVTDHAAELAKLKEEWDSLEALKAKHLAASCDFPRPSNREIAELIGIPEEKSGNVSQYLVRARTSLRKKLRELSD